MAQINFRIDDNIKSEAETLFGRLGMNMSTAIMVVSRFRHDVAHGGLLFIYKKNVFLKV